MLACYLLTEKVGAVWIEGPSLVPMLIASFHECYWAIQFAYGVSDTWVAWRMGYLKRSDWFSLTWFEHIIKWLGALAGSWVIRDVCGVSVYRGRVSISDAWFQGNHPAALTPVATRPQLATRRSNFWPFSLFHIQLLFDLNIVT